MNLRKKFKIMIFSREKLKKESNFKSRKGHFLAKETSAMSNINILRSQTLSVVPVAQGIARWTSNPEAVGSNPTRDDTVF